MMETVRFSPGFSLTPTLDARVTLSDHLHHQPPSVTLEQAKKLFFFKWEKEVVTLHPLWKIWKCTL